MTDLQKIKISISTLTSLGVAKNQEEVGKLLGYNSKSAFSQLVNGKVSIPVNFIDKLRGLHEKVNDLWNESDSKNDIISVDYDESSDRVLKGIPMYNAPGAAGGIEVYTDAASNKIVGYLSFPGITKESFALQVFGTSMNPTLINGDWAVLRPIEDRHSINWGQVYYIEYGDYKVFKRLLVGDVGDEVVLWSDNQSEMINDKPIHSPIYIKKIEIRKLCLVTDIYKKSNN